MMSFRTLALATLVVAACSRDRSRNATDSLPPLDTAGQATGATDSAARPDTTMPSTDSSALTGSRITVERAVVNGVLWGAAGEEVRRLLGAPQRTTTTWEEALGDSATVLEYPGMTVRLVERRVVGVHCTSQSCITGDAVRVGATRAEVEQVYGKGQEGGSGASAQLAYPFTTDDSCALRFQLGQGKVSAIDVSCHMN
jgi:hypothetical protein